MAGCLYREAGSGRVRPASVQPDYLEASGAENSEVGLRRWATAAVATGAVALRAEVSRACAAQAAFAP